MYLKRLEIQGFKSFADRVCFDFSKGVSAIVGPNGSGKSNVVDSVRWVLGEQSAKSLRGGKMEDVIFSGSKDRKALGMAKVTLVLDNSDSHFDVPYQEVSVSRTLHRSGESFYHLNGKVTRLKDIQELFMDTGLGKDGFSVIGQGKIDEILTLHAEDRRTLIEEAAGISKYKYRKKEASRKLLSTQEDLLRLEDILFELESQIEPLKKQADDVSKFKAYDEERETLEVKLLKADLDKVQAGLEVLAHQEKTLNDEVSSLARSQEEELNALETLKKSWLAERQVQENDEKAYLLTKEAYERMLRERDVSKERLAFQLEQEKAFIEEEALLEKRLTDETLALELLFNEVKEKEEAYERISLDKLSEGKEKEAIELKKTRLEEAISQLEERYFASMQEEVRLKNSLLATEDTIKRLFYQKERQGRKESNLAKELGEQKAVLSSLETDFLEDEAKLQALEANKKDLEGQKQALDEKKKSVEQEKLSLTQHYTTKKSRLATLNELESNGDGYFFGVSSVLKARETNKLHGILGTVAQLISVDSQYEVAIENALGGSLQYLITEDEYQAKQAISYLKANRLGKATFLPLTTIKGERQKPLCQDEAILGYGNDLVSVNEAYKSILSSLLGRTVIVRDIDSALRLQRQKLVLDRMVTLGGEVISPKGSLTGGVNKKEPVLLKRNSEKKALEKDLICLKEEANDLEKKSHLLEQDYKALKEKEAELLKAQSALRQDYAMKAARIESIKQDSLAKERSLLVEKADYETLLNEASHLEAKKVEDQKALDEIKASALALEKEKQAKKADLYEVLTAYESVKEQYYESEAKLRFTKEAYEASSERLDEKRATHKMLKSDKIRLREKLITVQEAIKEGQSLIVSLADQEKELSQALEERTRALELLKEASKVSEEAIRKSELEVERLRLSYHSKEKAYQELKLERIRQEEKKGFLLAEKVTRFGEALDLSTLDMTAFSYEKARRRLSEIKKAIEALGELNFMALEAYEEVSERSRFMNEQLSDLKNAESKLLALITEMEEVMSKRFSDTYQEVNRLFDEIFQKMFHGGSARLELSMPKNFLETGVEIIAKPPGKRERILSLLSGGERAMTAIALLFALLNIKPSPFVILDEIEAALDEANVIHLAEFIKDYSKKSQFIVISHRKGTMEACELLYGVSMDKDGVSKLLSVRLEDYLEGEG